MANLFDRDNYPDQEPNTLVAGDRFVWKRTDLPSDYPTDTYALTYEFHEADNIYYVEVASSTTASYSVGDYNWDAFITRTADSQRFRIDNGKTKIVPNLANTNADTRSHAKKVLDAIEAVIEGRASQDQMSYSIAGRSLSRMSIDDLLKFRDRYRSEYMTEVKRLRIKNKQDTGNTIKARF